jgi:hypothetical protein
MSNGKDSLTVYVLGWIAVTLSTAICVGLFVGIAMRVARAVAG